MISLDSPYAAQVRLLVRVLPVVARAECFALKGGTAINLFVRDMPRLSVDIDLAFLPLLGREEALRQVDAALRQLSEALCAQPFGCRVSGVKRVDGCVYGLNVSDGAATIKVEVSPVLRGTVYPQASRRIAPAAEAAFGFAEVPMVSFGDLYAGKIVAALDRQHPRDLFDIMLLLAGEGIGEELFRAFIVYVISHDGSVARLLRPTPKPLAEAFDRQFAGMTAEPVTVEALERTRTELLAALHRRLTGTEREFLLSFKQGAPRWDLLGVPHARDLPAVRWKLHNLERMSPDARRDAVDRLRRVLDDL